MDTRDLLFISKIDSLHMAFAGNSLESIKKLVDDIPKQYEKGKLSIDHYIALMNCGRTYMRILKEDNRNA